MTVATHLAAQYEKAETWLINQTHKRIHVDVNRFGVKQHVATIIKINRHDAPDLWYCINHKPQTWLGPHSIRRICKTRKQCKPPHKNN